MPHFNYEKAARRDKATEAARALRDGDRVTRRTKTSAGQIAKIHMLCRELDRQPTIPAMALDARLEIDRLQRVVDFRQRSAARKQSEETT